MKWLVYLLLLANVGLLAFELRQLEPDVDRVPEQAQSNGVKRLLLLSEVDPVRLEPADEAPPATAPGMPMDDADSPGTDASVDAIDPDETLADLMLADAADAGFEQDELEVESEAMPQTQDVAAEPEEGDFEVPASFTVSRAAMEGFMLDAPDVALTLDALSIAQEFASTSAQPSGLTTPPAPPEVVDDVPPERSPVSPKTQTPVTDRDPVTVALATFAPELPVEAQVVADEVLAPESEPDTAGVDVDSEVELDVASAEALLGATSATDSTPDEEQAETDPPETTRSDLSQVEDETAPGVIASEALHSSTEDEASAPDLSPEPSPDLESASGADDADGAAHDGAAPEPAPSEAAKALVFSPPSGPPQEPVDALAVKPFQPVCYRVGPFRTANAAQTGARWATRFAPDGSGADAISALAMPEEVRERSAVWIYLPSFDSRAEANEKMREMRAKGVKDMYVVNAGDNKNAVSLGVYGHIPSLERRIAALREFGYDPQTIERFRSNTIYWVDIRLERPSRLSAIDLTARFPDSTTESRSCDGAF